MLQFIGITFLITSLVAGGLALLCKYSTKVVVLTVTLVIPASIIIYNIL